MSSLSVSVIYSFGRSGSTLLNKCLGCHSANAILSEVNPAASCVDIPWQAHRWLALVPENELPEFARMPFVQQVTELAHRCAQQQRHLIVRDWSTINFLRNVSAGIEPSGVLEQELYLNHNPQLTLRRVVFTRRSGGIFHSIRTWFPQYHHLSADEFARSYLSYAQNVCGFPIIHLEDFTARPAYWLAKICGYLGLTYADDFSARFADFRNCTGNITLTKEAPSKTARVIIPIALPASAPPHPLLIEADRLLGYETN